MGEYWWCAVVFRGLTTPLPGRYGRVVPFIDIVPVGPAGSGKTSLLAAMQQGLEECDAGLAPVVRADPVTAVRLAQVWRSMRADGPGWPARTDPDALVDLRFAAETDGEEPLYETRLVDYDGSLVTGDRRQASRSLLARVRRADALLCVLDGGRIADLLDGDRGYFEHTMAGVWRLVAVRGKAVRFVVTKWDLLEGRTTLAEVRDALLTVPGFAAAARRRAASGSVGLIPVSVLGEAPVRDAVVPLWSVFPHALRSAAGRVGQATGRGGSVATDVGARLLSQAVTAVAVRQVLQRVVRAVPERRAARRYAGHAAVGVSMLVEAAVKAWCDRTTRPDDDDGARARLLVRAAEAYEWELDGFRRRYPDSDLTRAVSSERARRRAD